MATTSLGRLTLDLAVKLSEFTDGMTKAERETKAKTDKMKKSVSSFKEQIMQDLGGTQVGGVISNLNSKLGSLKGGAAIAAAGLAGMAVGGVLVATGALTRLAIETAKADTQLAVFANRANVGLQNFQVLAHASQQLGVSQEQLGSILADVQEKLGEFSATEGGEAADFFEALQNNTSLTTDEIRNLGKTLQGKDGVEAIQLMKDKLDELGATSQEQRFVFESLGNDLGNLLPLFENGGELLAKYGEELELAGVIKSKEAIEQSQILAAQTQAVHTRFDGLKQQLAAQMMPVLNNLLAYFLDGSKKGGQFSGVIKAVGITAKTTGTVIIGLAAGISTLIKIFRGAQEQMYNIGKTGAAFLNADGFVAKLQVLNNGMRRAQDLHASYSTNIAGDIRNAINSINGMWSESTSNLDDLSAAYLDINKASITAGQGIQTSTAQMREQEQQATATARAIQRAQRVAGQASSTLAINDRVRRNAERYRFAEYEARYGLPAGLLSGIHMQESHGDANATGPRTRYGRAKGGFQFIDATARRFGVSNAYDMTQATEGAAKYLSFLLQKFNGDLAKTIAAYNTGEGNIDKHPMSLILSGRWAKGQTRDYTKNVLQYMKGANSDTSSLVYQSITQEQKAAQQLAKLQESIAVRYFSEREKLILEHEQRIEDIKKAYAEGSADRARYIAEEEVRFTNIKAARIQSIADKYLNEGQLKEEQEIRRHQAAIEQIKIEFVENDPSRQLYLDLEDKKHQEELKKIKWHNEAKLREQQQYIESLHDSMQNNINQSASAVLDRTMQSSLSDEQYQQWRLSYDSENAYKNAFDSYDNRQAEINKTGELGEFVLPEAERFKLLEEAKLEHEQKLLNIESEYGAKRLELDKQQAEMRTQIQASAFSDMTSVASLFFGENSRMHRAAFALEKAYAVHKAIMNIQETYSNTFNAISAIPIVGPYIAGPMAAAASAMQVARAASLKGMSAPSVAGIAHGGLDYVPKEATYLLDEGEAVLAPKQNRDLAQFLAEQKNSSKQPNIVINNSSSAKVNAGVNSRGEVTIEVVDRMIKNSFKNLRNHNSLESKQIQRHTTARPRR